MHETKRDATEGSVADAITKSDRAAPSGPTGAGIIQFGIFCCAVTMVIVLAVAIRVSG